MRCRVERAGAGGERGQALVEAAVAFPLLVVAMVALVQLALVAHTQHVVDGAVQDGARVAAAAGGTIDEGVAHAEALLRAGLGRGAADVSLEGIDGGDAVAVEARGRLHLIVPWVADATLPLWGRAVMSKERFRAGPSR